MSNFVLPLIALTIALSGTGVCGAVQGESSPTPSQPAKSQVVEETSAALNQQQTITAAPNESVKVGPTEAVVLGVVTGAVNSSKTGSAPNIACDEPTYDFGELLNNRDIRHTYVVKNIGDMPLEISDVRTSCGCTIARISKKTVPPGDEAEVTAVLKLRGRRGHQRKSFNVVSNDPDTPWLSLYMQGKALKEVDISPNRIFFRQLGESSAVEQVIEIRCNTDDTINIKSLETSSDFFAADHEVIEEGKAHKIRVQTQPPLSMGPTRGTLVINTDNKEFPSLTVPLSLHVVGELRFSPKQINLLQSDSPISRTVFVAPGTKNDFTIEKVEPPIESIEVHVAPAGRNGYRIQLKNLVPNEELKGKYLKITTSAEGMKEIEIPFVLIAPAPSRTR